jgi:integrase/recombinase XerD
MAKLAVVRDLRDAQPEPAPEEVADFETDVFAGFVLARSAAGLSDSTIRCDVSHLEQVRAWLDRPLWEMTPADADTYFGTVLRTAPVNTRLGRSQALRTYFEFIGLRHRVQIHAMTGIVAQCPIDEINRPRGQRRPALRIPPTAEQVRCLFTGWRAELATCRKFAPMARNFAAAKLMSQVGLRVNEVRYLDLADIKWELGRFGKIHVRHGKGARGSGPRERMVPLINGADRTLRWFVQDVWSQLGDDPDRPGAPLYCSERHNADGTSARIGTEGLRAPLADAAAAYLPDWSARLTPHVLRHFCASQLYFGGMDLIAIQETLGHAWIATTMNYVHVHRTHVEDAWVAGQQRAADRLKGLSS